MKPLKNIFKFFVLIAFVLLSACASKTDKNKISHEFDFSELKAWKTNDIPGMRGTSPKGIEINVNNRYLEKGGEPWLPSYGEFQFSRYPQEHWEDAILKIKSAGFYGISTYVFWIHHEEIEGKWVWEGRMDFRKFIQLCKKHDMGVFARIGPWVHGEAAYGGHPEWLVKRLGQTPPYKGHPGKGGKLRTTHPEYIAAVDKLFEEVAKQMEGLYWKDGGPIFAIQLDNENNHHGKGKGADLMKVEKELAIKHKMEVPLFTNTGWGGSEFIQNETVPTYGSYSDNFWVHADTIFRGKSFSFMTWRADGDIGTDVGLGGKASHGMEKYNMNPHLTCETGTGMNMAYHRRTKVGPKENGALSLVELGGGCNAMGYFVFHGGSNPVGETGFLHESLETAVNDCSKISNDFQAAVGEFGQVRESFYEYPLQLHFMADFGKYLAPCQPFFPANTDPAQGGDMYDSKLLQTAVRSDGDKGFIFVNNYLMHDTINVIKDIQYKFKLKNETLIVPDQPVDIPKESYFIWPFNLKLNDVQIKYATVQPIAALEENNTYFFFTNEGLKSEFVLDASNVKNIEGNGFEKTNEGNKIRIAITKAGLNSFIDVETKTGTTTKFVVLTEKQAKQFYKNDDKVYLSDAEVLLFQDNKLDVISENLNNKVWVYPNIEIKGAQTEEDGIFKKFNVTFNKVEIPFETKEIQNGKAYTFENEFDKAGKKVATPAASHFDKGTIVDIKFPSGIPTSIYDTRIEVDYKASCVYLYKNDKFIYDNFYNATNWVFSANHLLQDYKNSTKVQLKFLPLQPKDPIYIAGTYWPDLNLKENTLNVNSIKVIPVYKSSFEVK